MKRFYSALSVETGCESIPTWFDKPLVLMAFDVPYALSQFERPIAKRRAELKQAICHVHRATRLNEIDLQRFLADLHTRGILHTLPSSLDRFANASLVVEGPFGSYYRDLFTKNWFNSKDVVLAFNAQLLKNQARVQFIKEAIYWDLGVVSFTQIAPLAFYNYLVYRGIERTAPVSLRIAIEQGEEM